MDHDWTPEELRQAMNAYPPYVGAGVEVTHIADDWSEIRVRMPLTERNRNLVGTHFGGSLYAMVDPHLMTLLTLRLGPEYLVWDRAACIDFLRPGTATVHATMRVSDEEVESIRAAADAGEKVLPEWTLEIVDEQAERVATVRKTLYVRRRADSPAQRSTE